MGRSVFSAWAKFVVVLFSTILIAGCGGGGSGGEPAADSSNGNGSNGSGEQVDFSSKSETELTEIANATFNFGALTSDAPGVNVNPGQSVVYPCVTGDYDAPSGLGNVQGFGDYTFNNCEIETGLFLNGLINRDASTVATFDVQNSFTDFSSDDGAEKITLNGTYYSSAVFSSTEITGAFSTNGGILNIAIVSVPYTDTVELVNVDTTYTNDLNNSVLKYDFSYTVNSVFFAGSVSARTTTTIEHYYNLDEYPRAGVAVMTGLNGGSVRVTALGDGSPTGLVRVEIDANGDGIYESSTDMTWLVFDS